MKGKTYRYEGCIIEQRYGHYEVYQGDDLVLTTDTYREATEAIDDMLCEEQAYAESLAFTGQWW